MSKPKKVKKVSYVSKNKKVVKIVSTDSQVGIKGTGIGWSSGGGKGWKEV